MVKKPIKAPESAEWNPLTKESWHLELENEPVNEEKWSCIVVATIQGKTEDEECIKLFSQYIQNDTKPDIKIINMSDIVKALKEKEFENNEKVKKITEKKFKNNKKLPTLNETKEINNSIIITTTANNNNNNNNKKAKPPPPRMSPIVNLARKYAKFSDLECELPPDLMAGLLKFLILNLKDENIFCKKLEAVKKKKLFKLETKVQFVKNMKPFVPNEATDNLKSDIRSNSKLEKAKIFNDELGFGPDLFIVLTDFYNPFYFTELTKMNVPFLAILKIFNFKETIIEKFHQNLFDDNSDNFAKKETLVTNFWKTLTENCQTLEKTVQFEDFIFVEYQPQLQKSFESVQSIYDEIFDEMSTVVYNIYFIYCEHQTFLREMFVQRMFQVLQPLDLKKCNIYNSICEALVTGDSNTVFLVLYAMLEQIVAGVPYTEHKPEEYNLPEDKYLLTDFYQHKSTSHIIRDEPKKNYAMVTPCLQCRNKLEIAHVCQDLYEEYNLEKNEGVAKELDFKKEEDITLHKQSLMMKSVENDEYLTESLIEQTIQEKYMEKNSKKYIKPPKIFFYGDEMAIQNYDCHPKLIDIKKTCERFLKNTYISHLWTKYPKLKPGKKAFFEFHFLQLLKCTKENKESLKIKIFFALCMKLIGIIKFYLYKGEEEDISESFRESIVDKIKIFSKVKFDEHYGVEEAKREKNFNSCSFKLFDRFEVLKKKTPLKKTKIEKIKGSFLTDPLTLRESNSVLNITLNAHRNSGYWFSYVFKFTNGLNAVSSIMKSKTKRELTAIFSLLDCNEISSITESHLLSDNEEYITLIENFNFYEKLEPLRMIQQLLEAFEEYNTTQCLYFSPTDSIITILHNDTDYRGLYYTCGYSKLLTPVALRDFYSHVYIEIKKWLNTKKEKYKEYAKKYQEEKKKMLEKKENEYLIKLKNRFDALSKEEKEIFLNKSKTSYLHCAKEIEVLEEELEDLPIKSKPLCLNENLSFIVTNFLNVRVENQKKIQEFYSKDGTEINVIKDTWLYDPDCLLKLKIKKSKLSFFFYHWLGQEIIPKFTLKTTSGIIFVFHKNSSSNKKILPLNELKYNVEISWPTGLIIRTMCANESDMYIKQYYLTNSKILNELKNEKSRCFLRNGQVLIFKNDGKIEVLCANGTKHTLKEFVGNSMESDVNESGNVLQITNYETITPLGEIWQMSSKNSCRQTRFSRNNKKLIDWIKVYSAVDPLNQETYVKRDDGVSSMLWPDGELVVNYPDGTKITSTPKFSEDEIFLDWTDDEKLVIQKIESKNQERNEDPKIKNKTILKKLSSSFFSEISTSENENEGFISITISYIIEHPNYATVMYDSEDSFVRLKMPDDVYIDIGSNGEYEVNHDNNFLNIYKDIIAFNTVCNSCKEKSSASISLDGNDILCTFTDFFGDTLTVYKNAESVYQDSNSGNATNCTNSVQDNNVKSCNNSQCKHSKPVSRNQRCFAFERNLNGIEFIHAENLARDCYNLSDDTYFDLDSNYNDCPTTTHLFSIPYYKIGCDLWKMNYENNNNSLPSNLKKKDLKELGAKNPIRNSFKYPFPKVQNNTNKINNMDLNKTRVKWPKAVITRIINCLSANPNSVLNDLKTYVNHYQKNAYDSYNLYTKYGLIDVNTNEAKLISKKLNSIAYNLNQSWASYPHLSMQVPSLNKEIHGFAHYINLMNELEQENIRENLGLPQCKQIPIPVGKMSRFKPIIEEKTNSNNDLL